MTEEACMPREITEVMEKLSTHALGREVFSSPEVLVKQGLHASLRQGHGMPNSGCSPLSSLLGLPVVSCLTALLPGMGIEMDCST